MIAYSICSPHDPLTPKLSLPKRDKAGRCQKRGLHGGLPRVLEASLTHRN